MGMLMEFEKYIELHRDKVFKKLMEYIPDREPKEHYSWVRTYSLRKGKYARPILIVLWCELYGGKASEAILPAASMQISEDWVLMHDDWEDQNLLRRGQPALHVIAGDYFSVNAGDALHMINWKIVHDAAKALGPKRGELFFDRFSDMLLVTAEGQYYDMSLTKRVKDIRHFTLEDYYQSIAAKTSYYTVYGPMQLGAIVAGQGQRELDKIREYGYPLGIAFQMKDDILDCLADEKKFGKTIGNDIMDGVKTAILWHFVQNAKEADLKRVEKVYNKDRNKKTKEDVKMVTDMFKDYKSFDFAEKKMEEFGREAVGKFKENTAHIPESDAKDTARNSIVYAFKRTK
jgi:geranylgeranyl pyrophosphate synthase